MNVSHEKCLLSSSPYPARFGLADDERSLSAPEHAVPDVRGVPRLRRIDGVEVERLIESVEEALAAAKHDGRDGDPDLVEMTRAQRLADLVSPTHDVEVLTAGRLPPSPAGLFYPAL